MHIMSRLGAALALSLLAACSSTTQEGATGVDRKQLLLVSSDEVQAAALQAYQKEISAAQQAGKLNTDKAMLERLRRIADRLIPEVKALRPDAREWNWEVNLETNPELNAYVVPGGKIMFYTGIVNKLNLTDAEIAAIMGHEISHALREHGRERVSQAMVQQLGVQLGTRLLGIEDQAQLANMGAQLLVGLPNSRGQEAEADILGLELMARAGYDPRAAVSLWQKMSQAGGGGGVPWLSTHPTGPQRIEGIQAKLPTVMPLYEENKANVSREPAPVVPRK